MDNLEQKYIELIKAGQNNAFGNLYDLYLDKIYRFIYYKVFNKEVAQDLTSETFIKAYEKFDKFNPSKGSFSSWLYTIARNTVTDYFRKINQDISLNDIFEIPDLSNFRDNLDMSYELEKIKEYINKLDVSTREVLVLRIWEELSYKEISQIVGKNEDNCKVIFSRAIKKLRDVMPLSTLILLLTLKI